MLAPVVGILFSTITGITGAILSVRAHKKYGEAEKLNKLTDYRLKEVDAADYEDFPGEIKKARWKGLAIGGIAGGILGLLSYKVAMLAAKASTGTKISELTGAAAKRATLAFFGGGALASGGMGMNGGRAVLAGIVIGPVVLSVGIAMHMMSKKALARARQRAAKADAILKKSLENEGTKNIDQELMELKSQSVEGY
ncbi:MAG: hypothetical protein MJ105_01710 [Lachnospiraceae bacterium]|nr:hypothetical protein [Lachnospiraceae bacterium]